MFYILKEINELSSGENGFYVDLYKTEEKAVEAMKEQVEEHIKNNQAEIVEGDLGSWYVKLKDKTGNKFIFEIEDQSAK